MRVGFFVTLLASAGALCSTSAQNRHFFETAQSLMWCFENTGSFPERFDEEGRCNSDSASMWHQKPKHIPISAFELTEFSQHSGKHPLCGTYQGFFSFTSHGKSVRKELYYNLSDEDIVGWVFSF